jgi:hypothetical protein
MSFMLSKYLVLITDVLRINGDIFRNATAFLLKKSWWTKNKQMHRIFKWFDELATILNQQLISVVSFEIIKNDSKSWQLNCKSKRVLLEFLIQ